MDAHKGVAQFLGHLVQLAIKGIGGRLGHAGHQPPVRGKVENLPAGDAVGNFPPPAEIDLVFCAQQSRRCPGEDLLQLLGAGRLEQIGQSAHLIALKDMFRVAGDKDDGQRIVPLAQPAGGLHAVELAHFHVQKDEVELAGMLAQPAQQALSRGEFQDSGPLSLGFQQPLQGSPQGKPRIVVVITQPNRQHGHHAPFSRPTSDENPFGFSL